jgi:hypothetical protein
MKNIAESI